MLKAMPEKKPLCSQGRFPLYRVKKKTLGQQGPILGVRFKEMSIEGVGYIVKPL